MAISGPFPALADRTPLRKCGLRMWSRAIEWGSGLRRFGDDGFRRVLSDVDVTPNKPMGMEAKDKPKVRVSLEAERDYYFKSGFAKIKLTAAM